MVILVMMPLSKVVRDGNGSGDDGDDAAVER